jgi:hypothetical protein
MSLCCSSCNIYYFVGTGKARKSTTDELMILFVISAAALLLLSYSEERAQRRQRTRTVFKTSCSAKYLGMKVIN